TPAAISGRLVLMLFLSFRGRGESPPERRFPGDLEGVTSQAGQRGKPRFGRSLTIPEGSVLPARGFPRQPAPASWFCLFLACSRSFWRENLSCYADQISRQKTSPFES